MSCRVCQKIVVCICSYRLLNLILTVVCSRCYPCLSSFNFLALHCRQTFSVLVIVASHCSFLCTHPYCLLCLSYPVTYPYRPGLSCLCRILPLLSTLVFVVSGFCRQLLYLLTPVLSSTPVSVVSGLVVNSCCCLRFLSPTHVFVVSGFCRQLLS